MSKEVMKHTILTVKERGVITLNGVTNVASFDENYVTLDTNEGRISVEGQGLKIESLSKDGGIIEIIGRIDGVFYAKEKKSASRLSKLFG